MIFSDVKKEDWGNKQTTAGIRGQTVELHVEFANALLKSCTMQERAAAKAEEGLFKQQKN